MITDWASVLISTHISAGVPLRIRRYYKEKRWSVRQKPDTVRIEPDTEWLYFNISWVTISSLVRTVRHKSIVSARVFYPSNEAWKGICTLIMYSIVIHNICILSENIFTFPKHNVRVLLVSGTVANALWEMICTLLHGYMADVLGVCTLTQVKRLHRMSLFMQEAHSENYKLTLRP